MRYALISSLVLGAFACSSSPVAPRPVDGGADATVRGDAAPDDAGDADAGPALPYPLTQQCATPTDAGDGCGQCKQEKCCLSREKILPAAVDPLIDCMAACDGKPAQDDCQAACFAAAPQYEGAYREQFACLFHNCQATCGGGGNACTHCIENHCALENMACSLDRNCFLGNTCSTACNGSAACTEACYKKFSVNPKLVEDLVLCAQGFCQAECQP